mgnify:CR=1 FL=1
MPAEIAESRRPLAEHFEELRRRLLRAFLWLTAATVLSWNFAPQILEWLVRPVGRVVFQSPVEPFLTHLKAALLGGIALSFPMLAWEIWGFLKPALRPQERGWIFEVVLASAALFFLGAGVGWVVLLPAALRVLLSFGTGFMVPMLTIGHYVNFASWLLIGCGIAFQIPLVVLFLSTTGLVQPRSLWRQWRLVTVGLLVLAALLTPGPDVVSQMLLAAPLVALYLGSVALSFLVRRG